MRQSSLRLKKKVGPSLILVLVASMGLTSCVLATRQMSIALELVVLMNEITLQGRRVDQIAEFSKQQMTSLEHVRSAYEGLGQPVQINDQTGQGLYVDPAGREWASNIIQEKAGRPPALHVTTANLALAEGQIFIPQVIAQFQNATQSEASTVQTARLSLNTGDLTPKQAGELILFIEKARPQLEARMGLVAKNALAETEIRTSHNLALAQLVKGNLTAARLQLHITSLERSLASLPKRGSSTTDTSFRIKYGDLIAKPGRPSSIQFEFDLQDKRISGESLGQLASFILDLDGQRVETSLLRNSLYSQIAGWRELGQRVAQMLAPKPKVAEPLSELQQTEQVAAANTMLEIFTKSDLDAGQEIETTMIEENIDCSTPACMALTPADKNLALALTVIQSQLSYAEWLKTWQTGQRPQITTSTVGLAVVARVPVTETKNFLQLLQNNLNYVAHLAAQGQIPRRPLGQVMAQITSENPGVTATQVEQALAKLGPLKELFALDFEKMTTPDENERNRFGKGERDSLQALARYLGRTAISTLATSTQAEFTNEAELRALMLWTKGWLAQTGWMPYLRGTMTSVRKDLGSSAAVIAGPKDILARLDRQSTPLAVLANEPKFFEIKATVVSLVEANKKAILPKRIDWNFDPSLLPDGGGNRAITTYLDRIILAYDFLSECRIKNAMKSELLVTALESLNQGSFAYVVLGLQPQQPLVIRELAVDVYLERTCLSTVEIDTVLAALTDVPDLRQSAIERIQTRLSLQNDQAEFSNFIQRHRQPSGNHLLDQIRKMLGNCEAGFNEQ